MTKQIALLAGLIATLGIGAAAQQPAPPAIPNISGLWNRLDTQGGGSYGGIDQLFPKAQLLPEAAAKLPPEQDQGLGNDPNVVTPPVVRLPNGAYLTPAVAAAGGPSPTAGHCNIGGGFGGVDINSAGMEIVATRDEVVIARDGGAGGRRIYIDRKMPDITRITPTAGGYSVGRFENGTLVATTTGFTPGMTGFGRGWRERETQLTEVFKLSPDGKKLTITYTWNDPKVYAKPHTYDISFERWETGYAIETYCDASIDHPENYTSIRLTDPGSATDKK